MIIMWKNEFVRLVGKVGTADCEFESIYISEEKYVSVIAKFVLADR